jgi:hypothetical protein
LVSLFSISTGWVARCFHRVGGTLDLNITLSRPEPTEIKNLHGTITKPLANKESSYAKTSGYLVDAQFGLTISKRR